ncbi:hypothetical protein [Lysinibacillus fusiformis]|uniref:hypothetical protein n=1 Tax=Lysinibacillus fusiformis TaxID=28031 RepID=UPI0036E87292
MSKDLLKDYIEKSVEIKDIPPTPNLFQVRSLKLEIWDSIEVHKADKFVSESYKSIHERFTNCVFAPRLIKILYFSRFFPIYIITSNNNIVYVGKNIDGPRFLNGHKATQKLNEPKYDGDKTIHFAQIWVEYTNEPNPRDGEYLKFNHPIEWLKPKSTIKGIVDFIERVLMVHFNSDLSLNKSGVKKNKKMKSIKSSQVIPIGYPIYDEDELNDQIVVTITDKCGSGLTNENIKWIDIERVIKDWVQ